MHKHKSKREELIRRVITYTMFPLAVILLSTILLLVVMGYRVNLDKQTVVQGGLMQFESSPDGATITVDQKKLTSKTNTRFDATAGLHTVTFTKDNYRPWQKTVTVEPGKILWLNYARLIPATLTPEPAAEFASIHQSIVAYRKDRMMIHETPASSNFIMVNISNKTTKTEIISLTDTQKEQLKDYALTMVSLDNDAKRLLVRAEKDTLKRWLVFDTERREFIRELRAPQDAQITEVLFDNKDDNKAYFVANSTLYHDDFKNPEPRAIVARVAEVSQSNEGVIAYTTLPDETTKQSAVGYYTPGAKKARDVKQFAADATKKLRFRIAEYARAQYAVIQYGSSLEVASLKLHASDSTEVLDFANVATLALPDGVDSLAFSPSSRFIVAQKTTAFTAYDLELEKMTTATIQGEQKGVAVPHWLDSYLLWSDREGVLRLHEFDGQNPSEIGAVKTGHAVALSNNNEYIYFVQAINGKDALVRVKIKL